MNKAVKAGTGIAGSFFLILGLIIGGCFVIVSAIMGKITRDFEKRLEEFRPYAETASGYVEQSYDGYTLITYQDKEGNEYNKSYNSSSTELEGTTVTVYYDKDAPATCMVPEVEAGVLQLLGNIFLIIGIVLIVIFCGIGIGIILGGNAAAKKMQSNEGQSVQAYTAVNNESLVQPAATGSVVVGMPNPQKSMTSYEEEFYNSVNQKDKPDYGGVNKDLL